MGWALLILGLGLALAATLLLLSDTIGSGIATAAGVLGIGLILAAGRWLKAGSEQVVKTIFSPDRQLRALVKQRRDGKYRVEVQKHIHEYSPDVGSHERWERQSNVPVNDTLASAVEIAARRVGAGTDDFFDKKA